MEEFMANQLTRQHYINMVLNFARKKSWFFNNSFTVDDACLYCYKYTKERDTYDEDMVRNIVGALLEVVLKAVTII